MRTKAWMALCSFALLAVTVFTVDSAAFAQAPGLVAAYNFNENTGTTLTDLSGNNFTGTINGATWTTDGKYGNALTFNGNSYIDLANPAAMRLTGSMTLEAWVKATGTPTDDGIIVSKSNGKGWELKTTPDTGVETFDVGLSPSSTSKTQRYSTSVRAINVWYHVAGVYDAAAGTLSTYVNGVLDNGTIRGTIPVSQFDQAVNVNIGRRASGNYFIGVIDEVRIYNRTLSQMEIQADMVTPIGGTPPPPDTIPPAVTLAAPANGATVAGTITVAANASDNVGVAGVQFQLDGTNLGSEIITLPFSLQWNTSGLTGNHALTAVARDFAGNTTQSSSITVTVTNPTPAQIGQWSPVNNWPIVAVHAMLLPTRKVLAWTDYTTQGGAQLWDPATNTFTPKTYDTTSLFCSGHAYMADGRLMITGGIVGLTDDLGPHDATIFNPVTETWSQGAMMVTGRYYPTATTLGDGRILVQGGTTTCNSCIADMPEIYDPVRDTWTQLAPSAKMSFKYYPHTFLLPDGRILVGSEDDQAVITRVLDLNTQTWTTIDSRITDGHSSVMYSPGKVLKAGTATADNPGFPAAPTAYVLDMSKPSPAWQQVASMANARSYVNLTVLPDGQVLATGGSTVTDKANFSAAVYPAELWNPNTQAWSTMASMQTPRLYHSTALLLPDATVLVAGGGRENGRSQPDPKDEPNAEIFSPPYLFKGPRPVITSAPSLLQYGSGFSVVTPDASRIASVSLIALSAVTHAFNENQRFVPLTFQVAGSGLSVIAPVDGNTAPPGPYMLFLVDTNGVPSTAAMVRLPAPSEDTQPPTPPTNLSATGSLGSVSLSWAAATDNIAVTNYSVYRSTSSGAGVTPANKVGQTASTNYIDNVIPAAGTYYYIVTAQDANGNVSSPSNEAFAVVTADTTPPTVAITAPIANATVSGVVSVTANATDNVGVAGVQFLLDGANLGSEVTGTGPNYSFSWNSTTAANGVHVLSARARDGKGNTATAPGVAVTVSNSAVSGLLAGYSFNQGSGTTVSDSSGNGVTGTISGATWTTGQFGGGLSFNGTSAYVDLGNPAVLQSTGSMTFAAWVKATANLSNDGQIVSKSGDGGGWQLKTSPDTGPQTFAIKVTGSSGSAYRYSQSVRALNTWYHVAGVYDATAKTLHIYVNGVLDDGTLRGTVPAAQTLQTVNVNIGRRSNGYYFAGVIDEVRVYNRALSAAEVQAVMNTALP